MLEIVIGGIIQGGEKGFNTARSRFHEELKCHQPIESVAERLNIICTFTVTLSKELSSITVEGYSGT
jgi:hypothetical protein